VRQIAAGQRDALEIVIPNATRSLPALTRVRDPCVGHLLHKGFAVCLLRALSFGAIVVVIKISKEWTKQTFITENRRIQANKPRRSRHG